jgi:hypothetical protein
MSSLVKLVHRPTYPLLVADILDGDPLGSLHISSDAIVERDELVFSFARTHKVCLHVLM